MERIAPMRLIFLLIMSLEITCLAGMGGGSMGGTEKGDVNEYIKKNGAFFVLDAGRGLGLAGQGKTNAYTWVNQVGEGAARQYDPSLMPFWLPDNTNSFPSLWFTSSDAGTNHLEYNFLASKVTGKQPFTIYTLASAFTNSNNNYLWNFGWSGSTNTSASRLEIRINNSSATAVGLVMTGDTNSAVPTITRTLPNSWSTGTYYYSVVSFDGATANIWVNRLKGSGTLSIPGNFTVDRFQIGCAKRADGNPINPGVAYLTLFAMFTNYHDGATVTNILTHFNRNRYKCF
jgi:hypothetical protein